MYYCIEEGNIATLTSEATVVKLYKHRVVGAAIGIRAQALQLRRHLGVDDGHLVVLHLGIDDNRH